MKLSTAQVQRFWREWPKSCKAMGWTKANGMSAAEIDQRRKEFLARCGFDSLTKVDRVDGFTKVLKELQVLQGVSVDAGIEAEDLTINKARTFRHFILTDLVPCLELYIADVRGYMTSIMGDKNRWWKIDRPAREITLLDLDAKPVYRRDKKTGELKTWPSQLEQLKWTLAARLNTLRKDAGDTIHDMRLRAGLECVCAVCSGRRTAAANGGDDLVAGIATADPELGAELTEFQSPTTPARAGLKILPKWV
jgi:hypothetical protein